MTSPHPLRHVGPTVFISYSFRDKVLAQPLHERLVSMGFQVQREDEESLANLPLDQELQRRIGSCEAFIQLRTETANRSDWMLREFDFARQRHEHDAAYLILPIVFDESSLPDRVRDWWYLSIGSAGLDDAGVDLVRRQLLGTVRLLPLASDTPFEFDATAVQ
jgi:TIR domain